ncbi:MAG: ABC transporter substrate-binding protein [Schumannella sp.]|nr:ABC transporter substrate-binding protein [Microbacteriaceae bacterium]
MHLTSAGRRRLGVAVGALAASALVLTGCSAAEPDGPEKITFSYLWGGAEADAIEAIIADFNASQDEVEVTGISSPDFQKQLTSLSASQGSFDISDHFGNAVGSWASKGIIAPLDDLLAANGVDPADFAPASIEQLSYDGKIYSLPIAVHTFQLLYNKTLLAEAGVEVPTTMDELADAIAALTKVEADGTITQLGLGDPSPSTTITTLGYAFGGDWDADGAPSPTNAANVEALQWYYDNVVAPVGSGKLAAFKSGVGEYMSPEDPFYTGKYAMVIDGEWRAVNIPNTAPDLDWGVTAIPAVSSALADSTQLTVSTLFIPSNSKHKEAAAKFLAYLVSDEGATAFSLALGNLPAKLSLVGSSAYDGIPQFSVWLDALASDNVHALSSAPYSAEYSTDLGLAFDEVLSGTSTPEAALQKVAGNSSNYATE